MTVDLRLFGPDDIADRLSYAALMSPIKQAMISYSASDAFATAQVLYPSCGADVHVKSAVLANAPVFTVKLAGWSRALAAERNSGHSGLILVCDARTCQPLAILQDDHLISDFRTGVAGALAAESCVAPELDTIAVLGAGTQAYHQVRAFAQLHALRQVNIWARRSDAGAGFAGRLGSEFPAASFTQFDSPTAAMDGAGLVILATSATEPLIRVEDAQPGQTLVSVGSDDESKCELPPELLRRADKVLTDSVAQARSYGNVARALKSGVSEQEIGLRELGTAWGQSEKMRENEREIILCTLTGLGVQDLAVVLNILDAPSLTGDVMKLKNMN